MHGIYIHIPFCIKKCKYCDFLSFDNSHSLKKDYLKSLKKEMAEYKGMSCDTVFIGGGTPTCLDNEELEFLFATISENFSLSPEGEFTIEANPKTLTKEKLDIIKKGGVNRISLGVQSFLDEELLKIGRVHTAADALESIKMIKDAGFLNFNIDLMSALPHQSFESFKKTLDVAINEGPSHISCYSLILEEDTPLMCEYERGTLILPDEEEDRRMYEYALSHLEDAGYYQYEISNFAKPGMESLHNIKYWECREYIGLGLGAHSYLDGERFSNEDNISSYINGNYHKNDNISLTLKDKMEEFMIMGLRMTKGISKKEFKRRFNIEIDSVFGKVLSKFIKDGFLIEDGDNIYFKKEGISVSNSILCEFLISNFEITD